MANVYFDLTRELNAREPVVVLASGQAVVYHRLAITSKDGDWIIRETPAACARVLDVLAARGATYRPGAPLDVRWLGGGWSSHFEFLDPARRRVRCDFFSRPPRLGPEETRRLFATAAADPLRVIGIEELIRMKRTQRARDYAVIGELARRLPPGRELEVTTDPDRVLALAARPDLASTRPAVERARDGSGRRAVVLALAEEVDEQQQADRARVLRYRRAAAPYLAALLEAGIDRLPLAPAHAAATALAERLLPCAVPQEGGAHADAQR